MAKKVLRKRKVNEHGEASVADEDMLEEEQDQVAKKKKKTKKEKRSEEANGEEEQDQNAKKIFKQEKRSREAIGDEKEDQKVKKRLKKEKGSGEASVGSKIDGKKERSDSHNSDLAQEVVDMIRKGIAAPDAQKDGKAFVPSDWASKYKSALGPYKKFLKRHEDKFALIEDGAGHFIIKRAEDVDPNELQKAPQLVKGKTWQKMLIDAWMAYCLTVPRELRSYEQFAGALPEAARRKTGGAPVEKKKKKNRDHEAAQAEATAGAPDGVAEDGGGEGTKPPKKAMKKSKKPIQT